jgi:hypothetical protein
MAILLSLVLLGVVIIVGFLVRITGDVHEIQEILRDIRTQLLTRGGLPGDWSLRGGGGVHQHLGETATGFFTVWEWRDNRWDLKTTLLPHGVDPGLPPEHPGAFEGECVKKWVPGWRV